MAPRSLPIVALMHPTLVSRPFHRAGWVYEEKVDGWRMVAYKREDLVQLVSRPGRDHTSRFPELVAAIASLTPTTLILDGEVCLFDRELISRFEWLRHGKPPGVATPPIFMAFDCLYAAGRDLRELALRARREWLEDVIHGLDLVLPARRLADNGLAAWAEVIARGYEGLVAKDLASPYVGGRTLKWLKVKQRDYRRAERGWIERRSSHIGC
jgi:bifunctional non-homologous end joining protein LigD